MQLLSKRMRGKRNYTRLNFHIKKSNSNATLKLFLNTVCHISLSDRPIYEYQKKKYKISFLLFHLVWYADIFIQRMLKCVMVCWWSLKSGETWHPRTQSVDDPQGVIKYIILLWHPMWIEIYNRLLMTLKVY
jgi:hypothetical protein